MNAHQAHWLKKHTDQVNAAIVKLQNYVDVRMEWVCPNCGNIVGPPPEGFMHEKNCDIHRDENGVWRYWQPHHEGPDYGSWGDPYDVPEITTNIADVSGPLPESRLEDYMRTAK